MKQWIAWLIRPILHPYYLIRYRREIRKATMLGAQVQAMALQQRLLGADLRRDQVLRLIQEAIKAEGERRVEEARKAEYSRPSCCAGEPTKQETDGAGSGAPGCVGRGISPPGLRVPTTSGAGSEELPGGEDSGGGGGGDTGCA